MIVELTGSQAAIPANDETAMAIEKTPKTTISPVAITANKPTVMKVDDTGVSPTTEAAEKPAKTDPRPTLADILKGKKEIRKDKAEKKARSRAAMPQPLAADLRNIGKIFAHGRPNWDVMSTQLTAVVPSAQFPMVLETGQA
uniref:AlNc14C332G10703 protein n=1 Tax=Albugo laibachii Nc14 TaxID=890382 RepID=F0WWU0_9STRA|nr:AlNc14C332G10703 [Albugo laibachii Nc14]|eukprot:CCA25917.1 AlNc14C332G10703 [Albugo laibachii Nc14]